MSSSAEKEAVRGILAGFGPKPVILELGAHVGEEADWIKPLCNNPQYIMVEPDPYNFKKIAQKHPDCYSIFSVIASYSGMVPFYFSENHESMNRASGSIRNPVGHLKHFPQVTFKEPEPMPCFSLDKLAEYAAIDHIDLLWCDIQGAERDMIEGGRATLAKTRYMMIETEPEVELYEGQALKPELIAMLPDWKILKDFGYNLLMWNSKYAQ